MTEMRIEHASHSKTKVTKEDFRERSAMVLQKMDETLPVDVVSALAEYAIANALLAISLQLDEIIDHQNRKGRVVPAGIVR